MSETSEVRHNACDAVQKRLAQAGEEWEKTARTEMGGNDGIAETAALLALVEVIRQATVEIVDALSQPGVTYGAGPIHIFNGADADAEKVAERVRPTVHGVGLEQVDERAIIGIESLADTYGLSGIAQVAEGLLALGSIEHYCHRTKRVEDGSSVVCGCRPT